MKIVCAASVCKYSSEHEDSSNIVFVSFPNDDTATVWAHNCNRPDLIPKTTEELHQNYYICSNHIENHNFFCKNNEIIMTQGAIPTIFPLQMDTSGHLNPVKSSYPSSDVINTINMSNCEHDYVSENSDYRNTIYDVNLLNEIHNDHHEHNDDVHIEQFVSINTRFCNLCRICGKNTNEGIDIFEKKENEINLEEKIRLHLPICVERNDPMPKRICRGCLEGLEAAHALVVNCLINDVRLRKLMDLPNGHNYQEKYQILLKNIHELEQSRDINNPELPKNPLKSPSNPSQTENQKYVFNSDLNNLILQPLSTDDTHKTQNPVQNEQIKVPDETIFTPKKSEINLPKISKEFKSQIDDKKLILDQKLKLKNSELNRRCGHCSQIFSNRKELQVHMTEHHNDKGVLFKCGLCDKSYEKWSSLDVHEATHRQDKPYLCDLCGKSFKHSNNLRGHKRVHLDISRKKKHVCEHCGSAFRSRFHLREHMNQHEGNKPYVCENCGKAFSKRIQLRQHRLSHGINKFTCPICGMSFNRRGNMNTHFKRHSSNDGTYKCSVCQYKCPSMSALKLHRKTHNETEIIDSIRQKSLDKILHKCNICNRLFPKITQLKNHERIHGDKIECDTCGKKLSTKSSLRYHIKSLHTLEKSHLCQFCGDSFVSKDSRLIHERIHTGERPYSCTLCTMQYRCSSNLNQHMKSHNHVRPFVCGYCSRGFTRKSSLIIHERGHTGEKPFICSICDNRFTHKHELKKHEQVHDDGMYNCEKCGEIFKSKGEILRHLMEGHPGDESGVVEWVFLGE